MLSVPEFSMIKIKQNRDHNFHSLRHRKVIERTHVEWGGGYIDCTF